MKDRSIWQNKDAKRHFIRWWLPEHGIIHVLGQRQSIRQQWHWTYGCDRVNVKKATVQVNNNPHWILKWSTSPTIIDFEMRPKDGWIEVAVLDYSRSHQTDIVGKLKLEITYVDRVPMLTQKESKTYGIDAPHIYSGSRQTKVTLFLVELTVSVDCMKGGPGGVASNRI